MQNVIEKILSQAEEEARAILQNYKNEVGKIKEEFERRILEEEKRTNEEIEDFRKKEILRARAKERLNQNQRLNAEMENLIQDVIQEAIKKLPEQEGYLNFLKEMISASKESEGELFLSSADFKRYKSEIEKFIKKEKLNFKITADEKISGGVVIKKGKIVYLGSLDVIVELIRDELKIEIARILFS